MIKDEEVTIRALSSKSKQQDPGSNAPAMRPAPPKLPSTFVAINTLSVTELLQLTIDMCESFTISAPIQ
jgi:hypothetical protein